MTSRRERFCNIIGFSQLLLSVDPVALSPAGSGDITTDFIVQALQRLHPNRFERLYEILMLCLIVGALFSRPGGEVLAESLLSLYSLYQTWKKILALSLWQI